MQVSRKRGQLRVSTGGDRKKQLKTNAGKATEISLEKPFELSLYTTAPAGELSLTDFEIVAIQRLEILKGIENLSTKNLPADVTRDKILELIRKQGNQGIQSSYVDQISHFILRLAFSKTEELRRWFVLQESKLFRARFESTRPNKIEEFFREHGLVFTPVEIKTKELQMNLNALDSEGTEYYKVPFEEALELVHRRQCVLHKGEAYVSQQHLVSIIGLKFRAYLSKQMAATYRTSHHVRKDERISPLLNMLGQQHVGPSFKTDFVGHVDLDKIPELAEQSFPLCMDHSYTGLKRERHMKHGGRMQFGLFLKGIGLSMEDALTFWQKAFSPKTDSQAFNKQYAYNIRHNYGKEGKRASYTPYSCLKIISSAPGHGDYHGCPFRHFDQDNLKRKMRLKKIGESKIEEIINLVQGHHFQIACQRYFQAKHNDTEPDEPVNHPNSYFNSSMRYWIKENEKDAPESQAPKPSPNHLKSDVVGTNMDTTPDEMLPK